MSSKALVVEDRWDERVVRVSIGACAVLGISCSKNSRHGLFQVVSLGKQGAIPSWNAAHPSCTVEKGDQIVKVNGARAYDDVTQTMKDGGELHFVFRRRASTPRTSEWLPVWFEWLMVAIIWVSTTIWAVCPEIEPPGQCPEFDHWLPPAAMWLAGYPLFLNFVSVQVSLYNCFTFLMNFVCLLGFWYLGALWPFLCGAFCTPVFELPVMVAAKKGLVKYDTNSYSLGVGWTTGLSNGVMFLVEKNGFISTHARFVIQVVGWTAVMSGIPILMLIMGVEMESYKLTLPQTIRYSAFQLSVYTFIYYGVCANFEGIQ